MTAQERERQRARRRLHIALQEVERGYERPIGTIRAQVRQIDRQLRSQRLPGGAE